MPDSIWLIAAALTAFSGMSWLALAMKVHWQQVYSDGQSLPNRPLLRWLGGISLLVSVTCTLRADAASMAALVWVMLLTVAALSVTMLLALHPQWLKLLCLPPFYIQSR